MRIFHAADLHIDSPLRGLDRYEGAPAARLRGATRRALENLVSACIDERAAVLLLAGDVFDGSWKDYSTGLFFASQMARLREAGISVVLARGNHDAASSITKALRLPENVRELSSRKAETIELEGLAVHGQSFPQRATTTDLAARYPAPRAGMFNVGLLHTSIDGREGHEPYAPTTLETLRGKGYEYWALGHVHRREVVLAEPLVVYPGNLQGRHARETGPKGATVLTVEDGKIAKVEARTLDAARWEAITVDVSAATDVLDVVDLARDAVGACERDGRPLAARVILVGRTKANGRLRSDLERFTNELRAATTDAHGDVWLEKIAVETHAAMDLARIREETGAVGHLARRIAAMKDDEAALATLAAELADLDKRLPAEIELQLSDPRTVRRLLEDVEQLLVPRLLDGGGGG